MNEKLSTTVELQDTNSVDVGEAEQNSRGIDALGLDDTPEEIHRRQRLERKIKWKLDLIILPLLSSVYFLAQMGRSDLGNAKISGMDRDLSLTDRQYSNTASIFLVGYLVFQLPGTLLVRKIGPPLQFATAMLCWGGITLSTIAINSWASLMIVRAFVGVAEAFIQGALFYLSFWYTYDELATRGAIMYSTAAVAESFNGLLAYVIQLNLDGKNGWGAWRYIFFIEGIIPMGWAFVVFFLLPKSPETAPGLFFSPEEKEIIIKRSRAAQNTGDFKIHLKLILKLLVDPKFWLYAFIDMGTNFCVSSLSNFLPAIFTGFGWTSVKSQLMTVIVYTCALVGIIGSARISDKVNKRGIVICVNAGIAVIAYALLLGLKGNLGRFIAACLAAASTYPNVVLVLSWTAINNPGYTYRASAIAIINVVSQCVAISGNQAYSDPPLYRTGNSAALALMAFSCVCSIVLQIHLKRENTKKMENMHSEESESLRLCSVDEISHHHPDVLYRL